jgi:hypothetical protein
LFTLSHIVIDVITTPVISTVTIAVAVIVIYSNIISKFLLALASTSVLLSVPVGTHDHIFILVNILHVFYWGLLFDERG